MSPSPIHRDPGVLALRDRLRAALREPLPDWLRAIVADNLSEADRVLALLERNPLETSRIRVRATTTCAIVDSWRATRTDSAPEERRSNREE